MFNRIVNLLVRARYYFLLRFLSKLPPKVVGKLMGYYLPKKLVVNNKNSDQFIWVMSAGAFQKDLNELLKIKTLNYIVYDQYWFSILLKIYFGRFPNFCNHFYGMENISDENIHHAIANFKHAFGFMLDVLRKKGIFVNQLLLPSMDQGGVRVLAEFAATNNIKTTFFYYEHYIIPVAKTMLFSCYEDYKLRIPPGKIILWHEYAKQMLINNNISDADNIIVAGPPRLQRWHEELKTSRSKKFITLLSFPGFDYWAPFTYIDTLLVYRDLSKKYLNYSFVVKCKDQFHANETRRLLSDDIGNLKITINEDMIDLLSQSKITSGFNTFSFLEAFLAKTHLILPSWGDSKHDPYLLQMDPQDPEIQAIVDIANSREHFSALIEQKIKGEDFNGNMQKRVEYLNKSVYFDENNTSADIFEKVLLGKL